MSKEDDTVTFNLELNLGIAYSDAKKLEAIFMRLLDIIKKFGLGEQADQVIEGIQKLITAFRMLQVTVQATMWAVESAAGPIGWAYAGVVALSSVVTLLEMG